MLIRDIIGLELFDIGAFLDKTKSPEGKGFKLVLHDKNPEAPLSPFYLNFRMPDHPTKPGPLTPEIIKEIARNLYELAEKKLLYSYVAGIPEAGTPIVEAFIKIYRSRRGQAVQILKLVKRGKTREIMVASGCYDQGTVLLLDDLITKAGSKLNAIQRIESIGLKVKDVLVLVDREQGGGQELKEKGYNLHSVFPFSELLELYFNKGRINKDLYNEIVAYLA